MAAVGASIQQWIDAVLVKPWIINLDNQGMTGRQRNRLTDTRRLIMGRFRLELAAAEPHEPMLT